MDAFEVLIKTQSDGVRFDLYYTPVLIDNIRLSPPDFQEFVDRLRATPQGVVVDYAGYLEPDPNRRPVPNQQLQITYTNLVETLHGVQFDLKVGAETINALFLEKDKFAGVINALKAKIE
jgi:hypothetical protein